MPIDSIQTELNRNIHKYSRATLWETMPKKPLLPFTHYLILSNICLIFIVTVVFIASFRMQIAVAFKQKKKYFGMYLRPKMMLSVVHRMFSFVHEQCELTGIFPRCWLHIEESFEKTILLKQGFSEAASWLELNKKHSEFKKNVEAR